MGNEFETSLNVVFIGGAFLLLVELILASIIGWWARRNGSKNIKFTKSQVLALGLMASFVCLTLFALGSFVLNVAPPDVSLLVPQLRMNETALTTTGIMCFCAFLLTLPLMVLLIVAEVVGPVGSSYSLPIGGSRMASGTWTEEEEEEERRRREEDEEEEERRRREEEEERRRREEDEEGNDWRNYL